MKQLTPLEYQDLLMAKYEPDNVKNVGKTAMLHGKGFHITSESSVIGPYVTHKTYTWSNRDHTSFVSRSKMVWDNLKVPYES